MDFKTSRPHEEGGMKNQFHCSHGHLTVVFKTRKTKRNKKGTKELVRLVQNKDKRKKKQTVL